MMPLIANSRALLTALLPALLFIGSGVLRAASGTEELTGYDKRRERRADPAAEQKNAFQELRRRAGRVEVDFDAVLASPKWVQVADGELTGTRGEGKSVPAAAAARHRNDPDGVVKAFMEEHRALFGHGPEALGQAAKTRDYVTEHNGVRKTVWQQRVDNIPVYESVFVAHQTHLGELIGVSSLFVPDAGRAAKERGERLAALRAVEIAVPVIGEEQQGIIATGRASGAERVQRFQVKPLPGEAEARLVWLALDRDTLRLCWQVELNRRRFKERFRVLVDARSGEVLLHRKLTVEIAPVTYRVFTNDSPTPMRPGWPSPNAAQPPFVPAAPVTISALDTNASPLGWMNDGELILRGNNVDARMDRDGDDRADLPRISATVDGQGHRSFDFPVDPVLHPTNYSAAGGVSLFYWCNFMHDRLHQVGFTENRGNYQKDNFGRGGLGNDAILADAQDGSGVNNANFTPAGDGAPGKIQMYLFTGPSPPHDGDFDAEVILHEYTHGMSDRLVGSGTGISQFQTFGLGEGWSDFFAEAMLTRHEDDLDANYPMGGYASHLLSGLQESYYFGIRRYPYTTATNISPLGFKDIDPTQASLYPGIPRNPISGTDASAVHRQGEVWCLILWEVRAALLRRWQPSAVNYAASNDLIMRFIVDGMDFTPPNPTFVQARDAILTAERIITGGANQFTMWQAFAKRGLGIGASSPDVTTTTGIVASQQTPPPPFELFDASPRLVMFEGLVGGPLTPASHVISVRNETLATVEWTATASSPSVVFLPAGGTLGPYAGGLVTVFTNGFSGLPAGSNGFTITFSNRTTLAVVTCTVAVVVTNAAPLPPFDVSPRLVVFEGLVGEPLALQSGNISVLNDTEAAVEWTATANSPAVVFSPPGGTILPRDAAVVTVFSSGFAGLPVGSNGFTLTFTNTTTLVVVTGIVAVIVTNGPPPPESLSVSPTTAFSISGPPGGPFLPGNRAYTLQAVTLPLLWHATNLPPWLALSRTSGGLDSGQSTSITMLVNDAVAATLGNGTHAATVAIVNIGTGGRVNLPVSLRVGSGESFMEDFLTRSFDLQNTTLTLTPSGNTYTACATPASVFPVETAGATVIPSLRDDEYRQVTLAGGAQYRLFGAATNVLWIGANGNLTPNPGINTNFFTPSLAEFFITPRVSPLYADLNPEQGGSVSWQQFSNRVVVTWENVPEYGLVNVNNCQVELFFDGHLRMTWLRVDVTTSISGLSRGLGIPPDFEQSDLSSQSQCTPAALLVLPGGVTEGEAPLTGTVLLSVASASNLVVTLTSGNTNEILVPATVTIPANQTSIQFPVTVVDDALFDGTQSAVITAEFTDRPSASATINVADNESARITVAVPADGAEGGGVISNGGFVLLSAAAGRDVAVQLLSSNTARVAVPAVAVVPAGSSMAFFNVTVIDDALLNGDEDVTIRASVPNWQYDRDVITVHDDESRQLLLFTVSEVAENGGNVQPGGTVQLMAPPVVDISVTLTSSVPGTILTPGLVVIAAGTLSNSFDLIVLNNATTNAFDAVKIIASAPAFLSATSSVQVVDDERPTAPQDPSPVDGATRVRSDTSLSWSVSSNTTPGLIQFEVYLGTNPVPTNLIASTTATSVTPGVQLDGATTYYWKVVARRPPFVKEGPVWSFTTAGFDHFVFGPVAPLQAVGEPFEATVTARDEFDLLVYNYAGTAVLTNIAPFKSSSTIVITEVDPGDFDRVEFQNVSGRNINISGWQIALYDWNSWPAPKTIYTIPGPALSRPGELFQARSLLARFFPGSYPNFNLAMNMAWNFNPSNNPVAVLLRDNLGNVVDFMCAVDAAPAQIVSPGPVPPAHWSNGPVPGIAGLAKTYRRTGRFDQGSAADWITAAGSIGTNNPGLSVPFTNWSSVAMTAPPLMNFLGGISTVPVTFWDEARSVLLGVSDGAGHGGRSSNFDVFADNDLSVTMTAPDAVTVGDPFTCLITLTNRGLDGATGVVLSNVLPPSVSVTAVATTWGECIVTNGAVVCDLGFVGGGDEEVFVLITQVASAPGVLTNLVRLSRGELDPYLPNNTASAVTTAGFPQLSISDLTNSEPASLNATVMNLTVRLSVPSTTTSLVCFATSDGGATAGLDYVATNGIIVLPPGATNALLGIVLLPDTLSESNETFFVNLSGAVNAEITDAQAAGTITDNDLNPSMTVLDASVLEGDGGTNFAVFEVRISTVSAKTVTVQYLTADATAFAGYDYETAYGSLVFPPGVTNRSVSVGVLGDRIFEPQKTFVLNLSSPANAGLVRSQGVCTITDDDQGQLHHFTFGPAGTQAFVNLPFPIIVTARDASGAAYTNFFGPLHFLATEADRVAITGSNSLPWEFPLGAGFHDSRLQAIYPASELGAAGRITALTLDVTNAPGQTLSNFTIRMKAVPYAQFPLTAWEGGGWTTNHQRDETITATGLVTFVFRTPFDHDGVRNLLVDYSFNNHSYSRDGLCRATAVTGLRALGLRTDGAFGDPLDWSGSYPPVGVVTRVPNARFTIGRSVSVTPLAAADAAEGFWSGEVLFGDVASNLTVLVVDDGGHVGLLSNLRVTLDGDGDGMPDWWEIAHGFNPQDGSDGIGDADGDGLGNVQEFLAGTDARNGASTVKILGVMKAANQVSVTIQSVAGKGYVLEAVPSLPGDWSAVSDRHEGTGGAVELSQRPLPSGSPWFYRVRVVP